MNITLPEETVKKLKKKVKARERSQVIAEALELYFDKKNKESLMQELINDYKASAKLSKEDRELLEAGLGDFDDEY